MKVYTMNTEYCKDMQVFFRYDINARGQLGLDIMDYEDGTPVATVNKILPDVIIPRHMIAVKEYSENKGMMQFLIDNDIATDTGSTIDSGYVQLNLMELTPRFIEEMNEG